MITADGSAVSPAESSLAHPPVRTEYLNLRVPTRKKTVTLVHGNYSGCQDARFPHSAPSLADRVC